MFFILLQLIILQNRFMALKKSAYTTFAEIGGARNKNEYLVKFEQWKEV
jgi:hypothetical protein